MGLCIKELDRIYSIREGSAGKVSSNLETNNFTPKNEEEYKFEKDVKALIESNLRQRVVDNANPIKLGKCFQFLNDWYGFIQGTNQYSFTKVLCSSENHNPKNQTELAESYGIMQQTMNNYM